MREEVQYLEQADIPMFTGSAASALVYSTRGVVLASLIDKTGMQLVQEHLANLSTADLERQEWLIRAPFASLWRDDTPLPSYHALTEESASSPTALLVGHRGISPRIVPKMRRSSPHW